MPATAIGLGLFRVDLEGWIEITVRRSGEMNYTRCVEAKPLAPKRTGVGSY